MSDLGDTGMYLINDNTRVVIQHEPYAEDFEPDYLPVIRIGNSIYGTTADDLGEGGWSGATETALSEAIERWSTDPSDRDWRLVERYMSAFYAVSELHTYYSGSYWYVSADSDALSVYKSWVEGEVYTITAQRKVDRHTVAFDKATNEVLSEYVSEGWEEVETIGGYIGYDHAVSAAKVLFEENS